VAEGPKKTSFPHIKSLDDDWPDDVLAPPAESARKTVAPPPDATEALAKASVDAVDETALTPPPPPPGRRQMATLHDDEEIERARKLSLKSEFPPPSISDASMHRSSLLSLANEASNLELSKDALDLVTEHGQPGPTPSPASPDSATIETYDPVGEMQDRFSLGDYSGSLVIAESLLSDDPRHREAKKYADNCRGILEQMYTARLGALDRVPFVAVPLEQLRWLSIDHRAGFVLSHVDGVSTLEQILDVSGMPLLDTLRILYELVQHRVVGFR
jgi:hypothetical protein